MWLFFTLPPIILGLDLKNEVREKEMFILSKLIIDIGEINHYFRTKYS